MRSFRVGAAVVDLSAGTVEREGAVHELTPIEVKLLAYLAARPGVVVPREELLSEVWGYREGVRSRTIDSTCLRLRNKLERAPADPMHRPGTTAPDLP